jgi:hypothetical protein
MTLPYVAVLQQLGRARLREAAWSVATAMFLGLILVTAIGLAVAAGVVATAERIGAVPALLAWAGALLGLALVVALVRMSRQRRRRLRELERVSAPGPGAFGASMLADAGFRAGTGAGKALSPLAVTAAAFVIGALIARTRR